MSTFAVDALLAVVIGAGWLGAAGFLRLRSPLDRLHCVAFVNAACGLPLLIAALLADGPSDRAGKIALAVALALLAGAASTHATARALRLRGSAPDSR